jgi:hypothetical protein
LPGTVFKVVVDGGDWGSPIANEAAFDNLEEAQAEAHSYLEQQRKAWRVARRHNREEGAGDGTVAKHVIA